MVKLLCRCFAQLAEGLSCRLKASDPTEVDGQPTTEHPTLLRTAWLLHSERGGAPLVLMGGAPCRGEGRRCCRLGSDAGYIEQLSGLGARGLGPAAPRLTLVSWLTGRSQPPAVALPALSRWL